MYVLVNETVANVFPRLDVLIVHPVVFFAAVTGNIKKKLTDDIRCLAANVDKFNRSAVIKHFLPRDGFTSS